MRLAGVRVQNFRCYKDEVTVEFDDITAIIGKNDAGKSSLLEALNIFFEQQAIDQDDACKMGDAENVRIVCEFDDLPDEIVIDAKSKTNLKDEYLLNHKGRFEVQKSYNCTLKTPKRTVSANCFYPTKEYFNDLHGLKIDALKRRAEQLEVDLADVKKSMKHELRKAIWASSGNLDCELTQVSLQEESGKEIWEQLLVAMPHFALFKSDRASTDQDSEAQDPMKVAVKEAIKQKEAELKVIADFVTDCVKKIADGTVSKIKEMDPELAKQLSPQITPPKWDAVFKFSLTSDDQIPINKRGSGVRRMVLLNFFRATAEQNCFERGKQRVIYAVEEPETSQHPNNQKLLMQAFQSLTNSGENQVVITTHTPVMARLLPHTAIRYVECTSGAPRTVRGHCEDTAKKVIAALGVLADHTVRLFIGVEGKHDIVHLRHLSRVLGTKDKKIPNLHALENSGEIIFVPLGGSSIELWASRLANLNRPEFYLCDRDNPPGKPPKYDTFISEVNGRGSHCHAACTEMKELENYLHPDAIAKASKARLGKVVKIKHGEHDDIPLLVAEAVHNDSDSPIEWGSLTPEKIGKKVSQAKQWLNSPLK